MARFHRDYGFDYDKIRKAVLKRDSHKCQMCGKKPRKPNIHHIRKWARSELLRYDEDNLITLCIGCHRTIRGKEDYYVSLFTTIVYQNKHDSS